MPRALAAFTREGVECIPAPTDFLSTNIASISSLKDARGIVRQIYPDSETLDESTKAVKEYFGLVGYRLAGWI